MIVTIALLVGLALSMVALPLSHEAATRAANHDTSLHHGTGHPCPDGDSQAPCEDDCPCLCCPGHAKVLCDPLAALVEIDKQPATYVWLSPTTPSPRGVFWRIYRPPRV